MSNAVVRSLAAVAGVAMAASSAQAVIITSTPDTQASILTGLVPLDLSTVVAGLTTPNTFSQTFSSDIPGAFSGTLTSRVFGNVGAPGVALNTVTVIYDFVGDGPDGIDAFELGLDSGANLDFSDLLAATHGRVSDLSDVGQATPQVDLTNNVGINDTMRFGFDIGGDTLGAPAVQESFSWYITSANANVSIGFVDVLVTNFGNAQPVTLSFVDVPGQPDLNVPAPGSVALLGLGGLAAMRRRR